MSVFTLSTKVVSGSGVLDELGSAVKQYGAKVFIVTDKGVADNGILDPILESLSRENLQYVIFDEVVSNPTVAVVAKGFQLLKEHRCDLLVAVGGGSPIDTAKSIALLATNGGAITDYEGFDMFTKRPLPLFTVPTTVGTGSEVTKGAVISDPSRHVKMVIASDLMYPVIAFLDPRCVAYLPGSVCAATGMDALTHALEGYISKFASPITDALNIQAMKMVGRHLRPAVSGNPEALFQMLMASCIAGAGFHNSGLGLVHAMANTLGGNFPIHHGIANAILLPYVMEFNLISNPHRFGEIAEALGESIEGLSEREAAGKAISAVRKLAEDVGIPTRLRDVGVTEELIPQMAEESLTQVDRPANPRVNRAKDIEELYHNAF